MFKVNYFKKLCSILTAFVLCAGMMVHISFAYGIDDYDVFCQALKLMLHKTILKDTPVLCLKLQKGTV